VRSGTGLVEVELASIEAGEVGDAAADRIEADQVGIERADARGECIDAALHLVAHRLEIVTLLVDLARDGGTIERTGDDAPDLQAGGEQHARHQQAAGCGDHDRPGLRQVELEHAPRPARDNV